MRHEPQLSLVGIASFHVLLQTWLLVGNFAALCPAHKRIVEIDEDFGDVARIVARCNLLPNQTAEFGGIVQKFEDPNGILLNCAFVWDSHQQHEQRFKRRSQPGILMMIAPSIEWSVAYFGLNQPQGALWMVPLSIFSKFLLLVMKT